MTHMQASTARSRLSPPTPQSEAVALATWVHTIPRIATDAIAINMGLGEFVRLTHAIKRRRELNIPFLIVTGTNSGETTYEALTLERLQQSPYDVNDIGRVLTQVATAHTSTQAVWLVGQVRKCGIRSVELHAPPYHVERAFLTVLAAMKGDYFILTPYATPLPPDFVVPEYLPEERITLDMMVHGEVDKIGKYSQQKADGQPGDVAGRGQLMSYLDWLHKQPEVKAFV